MGVSFDSYNAHAVTKRLFINTVKDFIVYIVYRQYIDLSNLVKK